MYCILVGGMPAAGKSHMARVLSERLDLPVFSKDEIKERLYDTIGFRSRAEKVTLGVGAMEAMCYAAGQVMARDGSVILENNFERDSVPGVRRLLERYGCKPFTLLLTGDYEVIYQRFLRRDQSPQRHRGHVVNTQYPEPAGEEAVYQPMSFRRFVEGFTARGMVDFDVGGPRLVVDTTDFSQVDYEGIAAQVRQLLDRETRDRERFG